MYLGEVMGEVMYYLILIFSVLFIIYLIIKVAVKHAVIAILPEIKSAFKDLNSEYVTKYELDKNKK